MAVLFRKKQQGGMLLAPMSGEIIPLAQVNDSVFSENVLGEGVAIRPCEGIVVSPCKGRVSQLTQTRHAIGITSEDGVEVLVHVGLDTVELQGKGFEYLVAAGQKVRAGQPIMKIDLDYLIAQKKDLASPVLIINMDRAIITARAAGEAVRGKTPLLAYSLR